MTDLPEVLNVGKQTSPIYSGMFGTDYEVGVCWRCRANPTDDPLETCDQCREELGE